MKDRVYDEWCQYQEEEIPRDLFVLSEGQNENVTGYMKYRKIDECWYRVLQITNRRGEAKYQTVAMIVKIALGISHDQADMERGFSTNKHILENRAVLGKEILDRFCTVNEVIRKYDSIVDIPITGNLLSSDDNFSRHIKVLYIKRKK